MNIILFLAIAALSGAILGGKNFGDVIRRGLWFIFFLALILIAVLYFVERQETKKETLKKEQKEIKKIEKAAIEKSTKTKSKNDNLDNETKQVNSSNNKDAEIFDFLMDNKSRTYENRGTSWKNNDSNTFFYSIHLGKDKTGLFSSITQENDKIVCMCGTRFSWKLKGDKIYADFNTSSFINEGCVGSKKFACGVFNQINWRKNIIITIDVNSKTLTFNGETYKLYSVTVDPKMFG